MTAVADPPIVEPPSEPSSRQEPETRAERSGRLVVGWLSLVAAAGIAAFLISINPLIGILLVAVIAAAAVFFFARSRSVGYVQVMAVFIHFELLGSRTFTPGRILAVVTLFFVAYRLLGKKERFPALSRRFVVVVGLIICWIWLTGAWAVEAGRWAQALLTFSVGFAYFLAFSFFLQGPHQLRRALRVYWFGGMVAGGISGIVLVIGGRAIGFTGDANQFAMYQATLIPLTLYFASEEPRRFWKAAHYVAVLTVSAAIMASASRSGLICMSVSFTACFFVFGKGSLIRKAASAGAGAMLAMLVAVGGLILNPVFLERGLNDRGAGRLDVWTVARAMINDKPFQGQGAGNFASVSIQALLVTPGVQLTGANSILKQDEIGAHNLWLEVTANLGLIGVSIFAVMILMTAYAFLFPKRPEWRRLHWTMGLMLVSFVVSTNFFGADTNKLLWMLVACAALLHTPSQREWYTPRRTGLLTRRRPGAELAVPEPASASVEPHRPMPAALQTPTNPLEEGRALARVELRLGRRFKAMLLGGFLVAMVVTQILLAARPTRFTATHGVYVPDLEQVGGRGIEINDMRLRTVQSLFLSEWYAERLRDEAGIDASVERVHDAIETRRPKTGAYVRVMFTWADEEVTKRVAPLLITVADELLAEIRTNAVAGVDEAIRPMMPEEEPDYRGPLYLRAYRDPVLSEIPPQYVVDGLIVGIGGAMFVGAFILMRAVRPMVSDEFASYTLDAPVWGRIVRRGRKDVRTDRVLQMASAVVDANGAAPSVLAVTGVGRRARRQVALDLAGALASTGQPVVLVDADPDSPAFSVLAGPFRLWSRRGWHEAATGEVEPEAVTRRLPLWTRFTATVRPTGADWSNVRLIGSGRVPRGAAIESGGSVIDELPPGTMTIIVAPDPGGDRGVADVVGTADATLVALEPGWTTLDDAHTLAGLCRLLAPSWGLVLVAI